MTLVAGQRLGSYEIVALLGAGGMGEVYRARDIRLERRGRAPLRYAAIVRRRASRSRRAERA